MKQLDLSSGYTVRVKGKGPFAFDHINRKYPDLPNVTRTITLATGDTGEWPYDPPEIAPDPSDKEEYDLYARWRSRTYHNTSMQEERSIAYVRFAKQHCVWITKGPFSFWDWVVCRTRRALSGLGVQTARLPFQERYLLLLDTDVIQTVTDWNTIESAMLVPEVTVSSVLDAATSYFRGNVGRGATDAEPAGGASADRASNDQHAAMGSTSGASRGQDVGTVV